jgi:hypothetical protein
VYGTLTATLLLILGRGDDRLLEPGQLSPEPSAIDGGMSCVTT